MIILLDWHRQHRKLKQTENGELLVYYNNIHPSTTKNYSDMH